MIYHSETYVNSSNQFSRKYDIRMFITFCKTCLMKALCNYFELVCNSKLWCHDVTQLPKQLSESTPSLLFVTYALCKPLVTILSSLPIILTSRFNVHVIVVTNNLFYKSEQYWNTWLGVIHKLRLQVSSPKMLTFCQRL